MLTAALLIASLAQTPPPSAAEIIKSATTKAAAEKKNVMVLFHASWCGWCKKLDAFMARPSYKGLFEADYVITHLVVLENGDKKALENAGGKEMMDAWGGAKAGLPFVVVLDRNGKMLGNSMYKDAKGNMVNTGCPWEPEEVSAFMTLIRKTAPRLKPENAKTLEAGLLAQKSEKK